MTAATIDVGIVGLGELGAPVAARLAAAGHTVAVSDRDADRVSRVVTAGDGHVVDGRDGSLWSAPVVLSLLPDSEVTMAVLSAAASALAGVTVVDMCSADPGLADLTERLVGNAGGRYVAATVLRGGGSEAGRGELQLAIGGPEPAVGVALPLLETIGQPVVRLPTAAAAQLLKLANNYVSLGVSALLAEAVALLVASGADPADCLSWLSRGSAANWVALDHVRRVAEAATAPPGPAGFRAALATKDLRYTINSASRLNLPAPIAGAIHAVYAEASATGLGDSEAGVWPWRRTASRPSTSTLENKQ